MENIQQFFIDFRFVLLVLLITLIMALENNLNGIQSIFIFDFNTLPNTLSFKKPYID